MSDEDLVTRARRLYPRGDGCVPLAWEMADELARLTRERDEALAARDHATAARQRDLDEALAHERDLTASLIAAREALGALLDASPHVDYLREAVARARKVLS